MGNTVSSISSPEKENSQRFEFTSGHSTLSKKELLSLPNISRRRHSASSCRTITFPTHPPFPSSSHSTFSMQISRQSEEPSKNSFSQSLSHRSQENIQFQYRNGRKYYNVPNSKYCLPLDDEEIDRLQLQHFLFRYIWQGNFSAPVEEMLESGCKVLDERGY
ncbi:6661_t:CDS:2 [Acaulospora morrowiae]|uniref:6661_t:CDS:1 n=1 Tax=Acaulospora morrowiae TaxID=94023 RepID=A0A9N8V734_9GLOM|nr:6661_t:CDS:2 [Acaulospora morrowiae]